MPFSQANKLSSEDATDDIQVKVTKAMQVVSVLETIAIATQKEEWTVMKLSLQMQEDIATLIEARIDVLPHIFEAVDAMAVTLQLQRRIQLRVAASTPMTSFKLVRKALDYVLASRGVVL